MTNTLILILIVGLATHRATRLWRDDTITEGIRDRVIGWFDTHLGSFGGWASDLLDCPWCISGWIAGVAFIVIDSATSRSVDVPFLAWLASWSIATLAYWANETLFDADQAIVGAVKAKGWR